MFSTPQSTPEDTVTQQYEEQVTELHCVIAELSRKLEAQKNLVITEEDEFTDTQSIVSRTVEDNTGTDGNEDSEEEVDHRRENKNDFKPVATADASMKNVSLKKLKIF